METIGAFVPLIAALPFMGALLPGLMIRAGRDACAAFAALPTLLAFILLMVNAPAVLGGEVFLYRIDWMPALGLNANFMLDGLGLLFAGLILGIGLLIILYARFYLSERDSMGQFYTYLLLFQGAMVGIVLSDNILLMLVFWELTSLSSFLLIGFWSHLPEGRQGARMALVVTGMGGLAMIAGMLILGNIAGSYDLSVILQHKDAIQASPMYLPALLLILLGAFTKSAQFPFHFWLPHAMAAPTPVSAYLHSATMVKAGLFLMARLWPVLSGTPEWFYIVATVGLITMITGAVIALFQDDLKALLAYSTVSHLGLITMLLGFGTPMAAVVAVFHIINHATFKAALFMSAGIIDHAAHTRDIARLGGLRRLMPVTFVITTVAALSMAGIPLFNGFLSKEMMLEEAAHTAWAGQGWLFPVLVTIGALFSVAYSLRLIWHVFLGPQRRDYPASPHDPGIGMWGPAALLAVLVVLIGLMPALIAGPLVAASAGAVIGGELPDYALKIWHGFTPALWMSIVAVAGGAVVLSRHAGLAGRWQRGAWLQAKGMFDAIMRATVGASRWCADLLHDGAFTRFAGIFVITAAVAGLWAWSGGDMGAPNRVMAPVNIVALTGWVLLVGAVGALVLFHHNRMLALILVGVAGLIVSLGFVYLSAPDLALTQISVEVVTIVLMLLALNFLPNHTPRESAPARRFRDGAIALLGGGAMAALVYAILLRDSAFESISAYHLANSYIGGGGTNVVNVILVDFRGFDTLGEITVLGIAGLIIFALSQAVVGSSAGRWLDQWRPEQALAGDRHPVMMIVATQALMPIALLVGVYIFLRGHNEPGGGFISGLIVAIAVLMQYMASGFDWAVARQRFQYHTFIALGVLIASFTGIAAWFADRPFLTSDFGYFRIPPMEQFELATAMAFDLGVFLTVVGAVMLALESLSGLSRGSVMYADIRPAPEPAPDEIAPAERMS
ncbi:MAG: monovalent cation/H+ antiporter subunit A [Paracoccaceae bacterium]